MNSDEHQRNISILSNLQLNPLINDYQTNGRVLSHNPAETLRTKILGIITLDSYGLITVKHERVSVEEIRSLSGHCLDLSPCINASGRI